MNTPLIFIVFLVRERGKYWTKLVVPENRTIEALKSAIISLLRPNCGNCDLFDIHDKYDRHKTISSTDEVRELPDYFEMEVDVIEV